MGGCLAQAKAGYLDIAFTPQRHVWNGHDERQLVLKDLRVHAG
jgi:hypothetical protein